MPEFIKAPVYMCKLVSNEDVQYHECLGCAEMAREVFHDLLKDEPSEVVLAAYLDGRNKLIGVEVVSRGGLHGAALSPRDILRGAFLVNASAVILGHNHPSGDPALSVEDKEMATILGRIFDTVGMRFLDSIVVTRDGRYSSWKWELGRSGY